MNDQAVSEKIVNAGEAVTQVRSLIQARIEALSASLVAAVIESKKSRKLEGFAQDLRDANDAANHMNVAMTHLEMAFKLTSGAKAAKGISRKSQPRAVKPSPNVTPNLKRRRAQSGKAIELVLAEVKKVITNEWQILHQKDIAENAGVSVGSVSSALKKLVQDGTIQHQGKEYKLP